MSNDESRLCLSAIIHSIMTPVDTSSPPPPSSCTPSNTTTTTTTTAAAAAAADDDDDRFAVSYTHLTLPTIYSV